MSELPAEIVDCLKVRIPDPPRASPAAKIVVGLFAFALASTAWRLARGS